MVRSRYVFILPALALGACVTPKSPGTGESTGDGATDSMTGNDPTPGTGDETTGDPICPPNPAYTCTAPPGTFASCGEGWFDENCCLPLVCQDDDDCAEGETCQRGQYSGLGCYDVEVDGEIVCECSADPGGFPPDVCKPPADEWCAVHTDEASCNGAPEMENLQFCQWIELHTLTIDADSDTCGTAGPTFKCLTFDFDPSEGCGPEPCSLGPLVMSSAIAREIGTGTYEVWGLHDVFCGGGDPVGDWIPADDPSLAQCQMACGFDNPCAIPLVEYVEIRSDESKDAPVDDCGALTLDDPIADWEAAQTCALDHATMGAGFRLVADGQGIDSVVQVGFAGMQGLAYAVSRFSSDSGGVDFDTVFEEPGGGLAAVNDCVVAVGELCLAVTAPGEVVQLCP